MTIGQVETSNFDSYSKLLTGRGQFFKTPHHPTFELDQRMAVVDVALATSAAPVYFPIVRNFEARSLMAD